jgi:ABC-type sugar transport system substrate-binding protein
MKRTSVLAVLTLALSTLASASAKPSASAQPEGAPALTLEPVATLASPIALATRAGTDDLYVAEREGRVRVLHVTGTDVTLDPTPLLDITRVTTTNG